MSKFLSKVAAENLGLLIMKYKLKAAGLILIFTLLSCGGMISLKFRTENPFLAGWGLIQIFFTDTEFAVIQDYPRVVLAKPEVSLDDYMAYQGMDRQVDEQMGAIHVFSNHDCKAYIHYSMNTYYSLWRWQE